jgi:hypothetical protein
MGWDQMATKIPSASELRRVTQKVNFRDVFFKNIHKIPGIEVDLSSPSSLSQELYDEEWIVCDIKSGSQIPDEVCLIKYFARGMALPSSLVSPEAFYFMICSTLRERFIECVLKGYFSPFEIVSNSARVINEDENVRKFLLKSFLGKLDEYNYLSAADAETYANHLAFELDSLPAEKYVGTNSLVLIEKVQSFLISQTKWIAGKTLHKKGFSLLSPEEIKFSLGRDIAGDIKLMIPNAGPVTILEYIYDTIGPILEEYCRFLLYKSYHTPFVSQLCEAVFNYMGGVPLFNLPPVWLGFNTKVNSLHKGESYLVDVHVNNPKIPTEFNIKTLNQILLERSTL